MRRRPLLLLAAAALLAAPSSARADTYVGQIVTIDGRDYEVRGIATGAGGGALLQTGALGTRLPTTAPTCKPGTVTLTIGDITGTALAALSNGDIYYKWNAQTSVRIGGSCDAETINRQSYVDRPVIAAGIGHVSPAYSPVFEARVVGNATATQSPDWLVLYYSPSNLATRAVYGSITVEVRGSYVVAPGYAGAGSQMSAGCRQKTWFFWATPTGPEFDTQATHEQSCV